MEREAIFWTSTTPGYNDRDRMRVSIDDNGMQRIERVPQRGHLGDPDDRRPAPGTRAVVMVDHYGNSKFVALTNGAAHLDPNTPYGQNMMALARWHGWYKLDECPCALLAVGQLHGSRIVDPDVLRDTPCQPGTYAEAKPCRHVVAEKKARMDRNARLEEAKEGQYKSEERKRFEAQQFNHSELMSKLTEAIATTAANNNNGELIKNLIAEMRALSQGAPPSREVTDKPISPQEKRERLVGSYQDSYRRLGIDPKPADVESLVVADLELVDAADRAGELGGGAVTPASREQVVAGRKTARQIVADESREQGTPLELRYDGENGTPIQTSVFDGDPSDDEWRLARGRIRRITEGASSKRVGNDEEGRPMYATDWSTAGHPQLAKEMHELTAFYLMRHRPPIIGKTSHNPFLGLSEVDAARLLRRKTIDICNRSTGKLGHWYVK